MISDILSEAKADIESYLLGDDRGYSSDPELCDQIWKLLQDMEALRLRLDTLPHKVKSCRQCPHASEGELRCGLMYDQRPLYLGSYRKIGEEYEYGKRIPEWCPLRSAITEITPDSHPDIWQLLQPPS
ncbi:MAG: hypothetical protein KME13_24255 [Myxacorys californica WJT36-NPBG1]|jgi:hypothetical protein|nr:hypothetical protein [Myxacorys californica WJT36-NPBG1]